MFRKVFLVCVFLFGCTNGVDRSADESRAQSALTGPQPLSVNRDRLFATLAARKGISTCDLWASMGLAERYVFLIDTKGLSTRDSYIWPPRPHYWLRTNNCFNPTFDCDGGCYLDRQWPPWCAPTIDGTCQWMSGSDCAECGLCETIWSQDNFETLLDHATILYSVNAPKPGEGIAGDGCGGENYNRSFIGFDDTGKWAIRNYTIAGGRWVTSDDCTGPHDPFNAREDLDWGSAFAPCRIPPWQHNGPTRHHWKYDSDFSSLDGRLGVCHVTDPSIVEFTISYNWLHDANPLCIYGGIFGYQKVEDRMGAAEYDWTPSGCVPTPPSNTCFDGCGLFHSTGPPC